MTTNIPVDSDPSINAGNSASAPLTVAEFISNRIEISGKTQKQIASEVGFPKPNMITMIKQGASKLPLDKIALMAKALNVEKLYLYRLVMQEYEPGTWNTIQNDILSQPVLTKYELDLVALVRDLNIQETRLVDKEDHEILAKAFQKISQRHQKNALKN
ncbi:helix-turn-helix transcriptional regulator [Undibacterium sp. RTI2.2]|uniref:helix-turn-helix domain-containing protein n=1 Tax=unclassified Undibacterium TaxID=2630295 RepID=UPI002AB391D8|nr:MULTISPECIES: helix-turn-helix transcriptional regulator [unclassified Undibacterium]MDY7537521.1 helix-turn-helix transcriptional regulator [Undibacterium sp. 5I1]MEB0115427.1 helix-turn-helix transcriptional regulator [Undibacterium sp. RTI2.2]MEB0232898.1 helix-turn-helix transcriptional regulator [Undibacterium sp. 10I3]MEB0256256.1 helix-turn-helix transcriptional regulator [Undibacterium sp. 5I1]